MHSDVVGRLSYMTDVSGRTDSCSNRFGEAVRKDGNGRGDNSFDCIASAARLKVSIADLNADFEGLPEYPEAQAGRLLFESVRSVGMDFVLPGVGKVVGISVSRSDLGRQRWMELQDSSDASVHSDRGHALLHCIGGRGCRLYLSDFFCACG